MPFFSSENKYYDEISSLGDIGIMISALLRESSVEEELWDIFEDLIRNSELEQMKETLEDWEEERATARWI